MMQCNFTDGSSRIGDLEMKENMHSYPSHQQQHDNFFKSTLSNDNMTTTTSDIWQTSTLNSNTNYQSFHFPSTFELNNSSSNPSQYHTMNNNFDYQPLPDISSSHLIDPYSHVFTNNYSIDPHSTQTSMDYSSSTYVTPSDSYQHFSPVYASSPGSSFVDYQPISSQWSSSTVKMQSHDVTSTSNSSKQPCLVCHDESSGYHFGAYTCESCKAFYRRVTKDPNIEIKHSCKIPLLTITKSNRKDCRACRKAKCDQVGMTFMSKDRPSRLSKMTSKSPSIPITDLLEQLSYDLTYDQLSTSSAFENLLHLLDLPIVIPLNFDSHSLYMNAMHIWRNQDNHCSQRIANLLFNDIFPVLLFLFYTFMIIKEDGEDKSINYIKFTKLVNILQQEIHRITSDDHRLACRIKALFMKSYVALAQYYPNSTNISNSNHTSQFIPYQQHSIYGQ